jgi:hypothetical protein
MLSGGKGAHGGFGMRHHVTLHDPEKRQETTPWLISSLVTCVCGHTLDRHSTAGCSDEDCACDERRRESIEAEVTAIDEVR